MKTIPNLADISLCTGCGACVSSCPRHCLILQADAEGFAYPVLSDSSACSHCGLCTNTCPLQKKESSTEDRYPLAYAVQCTDSTIRTDSSSGGVFSLLALDVLSYGGTVYGAAYDNSFHVIHIPVTEASELHRLRGAKYAQSDLGTTFRDIKTRLIAGQQVLFSGTPCQVAGLQAYLNHEYDNLLCVDFVCHGVPSPAVWQQYVAYRAGIDNNGNLPQSVNLRSKITGWSRYQYCNLFCYPNSKIHIAQTAQSPFMQLFVNDCISRPSCEHCMFKGYHRCSDITLGDFWGIWDILPEMDDNNGTSVVLLHSQKALNIYQRLSGNMVSRPVSLDQASCQNPSMLYASPGNPLRNQIFSALQKGDWERCLKLLQSPRSNIFYRILNRVKRLCKKVFP